MCVTRSGNNLGNINHVNYGYMSYFIKRSDPPPPPPRILMWVLPCVPCPGRQPKLKRISIGKVKHFAVRQRFEFAVTGSTSIILQSLYL